MKIFEIIVEYDLFTKIIKANTLKFRKRHLKHIQELMVKNQYFLIIFDLRIDNNEDGIKDN